MLSEEEAEQLLRHGIYDILSEESKYTDGKLESQNFIDEDIDSILLRRSTTTRHPKEAKNRFNFNKTSFKASREDFFDSDIVSDHDIDVDDPKFWQKISSIVKNSTSISNELDNKSDHAKSYGEDTSLLGDDVSKNHKNTRSTTHRIKYCDDEDESSVAIQIGSTDNDSDYECNDNADDSHDESSPLKAKNLEKLAGMKNNETCKTCKIEQGQSLSLKSTENVSLSAEALPMSQPQQPIVAPTQRQMKQMLGDNAIDTNHAKSDFGPTMSQPQQPMVTPTQRQMRQMLGDNAIDTNHEKSDFGLTMSQPELPMIAPTQRQMKQMLSHDTIDTNHAKSDLGPSPEATPKDSEEITAREQGITPKLVLSESRKVKAEIDKHGIERKALQQQIKHGNKKKQQNGVTQKDEQGVKPEVMKSKRKYGRPKNYKRNIDKLRSDQENVCDKLSMTRKPKYPPSISDDLMKVQKRTPQDITKERQCFDEVIRKKIKPEDEIPVTLRNMSAPGIFCNLVPAKQPLHPHTIRGKSTGSRTSQTERSIFETMFSDRR